jgi:signal transduction histidine kinase
MLDFSRQSGSVRGPCDLSALIERAVTLASSDYDLKKSYDFRKIEIIRDIAPDMPHVVCAQTEIEQVVLNLLRNAAQAMASAEPAVAAPRIVIRARVSGGMARIEIEDNGPGMDQETQRRIFEPFFTTKPTGVGTGLGLSVSYFIVTKGHGGSIAVDSSTGRGTMFTIELPLDAHGGERS